MSKIRPDLLCIRSAIITVGLLSLGACSLRPLGTAEEEAKLNEAGKAFEHRIESRTVADLPAAPTWKNLLERAFAVNGDLESAFFDWKGAVERIGIASAYPNANISLGYGYTFSNERMKSFDRMMFSAGVDPMENLSFPGKTAQAGRVALAEARASGERFRKAKFDLQQRVLTSWADYMFLVEKMRIVKEKLALSKAAISAATGKALAGGAQIDILKSDISAQLTENELRNIDAELAMARAALNALLQRNPEAALTPPSPLPEPRPVPADDSKLIAWAAQENPEIRALAFEAKSKSDALELARLRWLPDINPVVAFTGAAAQAISATVILPTTISEIRGQINEADAALRSSEAALRQAQHEQASKFIATLISLRNAERQEALLSGPLLLATRQALTVTEIGYTSGQAGYLDLIESQRTLLDLELSIAEAHTLRDTRLAELEAIAGADVESFDAALTTIQEEEG